MMIAPRTPRKAVAMVAVAAVLAGCAGIPSSGPVERVADDGGPDQSTVRYAPVGPARGASPQQIVRGFLDAMLAYPVSTGTAALYLTPDAAKRWRSSQGVTVYSSPEVSLSGTDVLDAERESVIVDLRTTPVARLDRQGHFTSGGDERPREYVLEKVKGRWRISNPQDGVMVTRTYYDDYFRPFSLYFFDAPGERVVPDLVHLAVGEQLPTALVTALARGPGRTPGNLRTFVPGVASLRPSVTVGTRTSPTSSSRRHSPSCPRASRNVWRLRSCGRCVRCRRCSESASSEARRSCPRAEIACIPSIRGRASARPPETPTPTHSSTTSWWRSTADRSVRQGCLGPRRERRGGGRCERCPRRRRRGAPARCR